MSTNLFFDLWTDPVLRGSTWGCIWMCLAASLIGVAVFLQKRSLLGETLSHASYPGVVLSALFLSYCVTPDSTAASLIVLAGAAASAGVSLLVLDWLERKIHIPSDAALCFVLSAFFGCGVLVLSRLQLTHPLWVQYAQLFLYGQPATVSEEHLLIYGLLAAATLLMILLFYRSLKLVLFDRAYARTMGAPVLWMDRMIALFLVLAIVVGMRSIGVVLMSGMLIAPPLTARLLTARLGKMWSLSAVVGVVSAILGSYLSLLLPRYFQTSPHARPLALPAGPTILLVASAFCLAALLLAPPNGLLRKWVRRLQFRESCLVENALKACWKGDNEGGWDAVRLSKALCLHPWSAQWILLRMHWQGWVKKEHLPTGSLYQLTRDGLKRARIVVRIHRLWEVYLVRCLGQNLEKVHQNAEEMEHILTPELEKELSELLGHPEEDPHQQPIPSRGGPV